MAHRIWPGTRALAQLHLDQGQRVWLVTAAPIEIAQIIARRLGLTGAMGTVAEHVDGVYTGRLVGDMLHGPAKGEAVRALAGPRGARPRRAARRTPTPINDLPMLTLVGDPCAINPDARLRAHARAAGLADPRLPDRPQGGPRRPRSWARWRGPRPARSPPGSRSAAAGARLTRRLLPTWRGSRPGANCSHARRTAPYHDVGFGGS